MKKFTYFVWFLNFPNKTRQYKHLKNALKFIIKQKNEVYLNWYVNEEENDTMFGLNINK